MGCLQHDVARHRARLGPPTLLPRHFLCLQSLRRKMAGDCNFAPIVVDPPGSIPLSTEELKEFRDADSAHSTRCSSTRSGSKEGPISKESSAKDVAHSASRCSLDKELRNFVDPCAAEDTAHKQSKPFQAVFSKKRWKYLMLLFVFINTLAFISPTCSLLSKNNMVAETSCFGRYPDYYSEEALMVQGARGAWALVLSIFCAAFAWGHCFDSLRYCLCFNALGFALFDSYKLARLHPPDGWHLSSTPPTTLESIYFNGFMVFIQAFICPALCGFLGVRLQRFTFVWVFLALGISMGTSFAVAFALTGHPFIFCSLFACLFTPIGSHIAWRAYRGERRARRLVAQDQESYAVLWQRILQTEKKDLEGLAISAAKVSGAVGHHAPDNALMGLAKTLRSHVSAPLRQPVISLDQLYSDAELVNEAFQDNVGRWARQFGGVQHVAPKKGSCRSLQKLRRAYADDPSRLLDVVRSAVVFSSASSLLACFNLIAKDSDIRRVKNRMDPSYDASLSAGYRDLSLNIAVSLPDGREHLCEIQLHLSTMYAMKTDGGHQRYIAFRNALGD